MQRTITSIISTTGTTAKTTTKATTNPTVYLQILPVQ